MLGNLGKNQCVCRIIEPVMQILPVFPPFLHKCGEFLQLRTADGSLQISCLQIVSEMAVDVFMVIPQRKLSVLPVEPVSAHIVSSRWAHAVTSPIAQGTHNLMEQRVRCVDSPTLPHSHMMGRIEA